MIIRDLYETAQEQGGWIEIKPTAASIAADLTVRERLLLFCLA
jgi:hypothetical protein